MMSSSRLKPSLTPRTLFATSARIRPWKARVLFSSSFRSNLTTLFSMLTEMPGTSGVLSEPFGSAISFFPIRDMAISLPDLAEHFAADAALRGFGTRENALRGRHDGESESAENLRQLFLSAVDAAARTRNALDAVDHGLAVIRVLEVEAQRALRLAVLLDQFVVADEAFGLE